ncbi:glycosyltransferase family 4 protein [Desulfofundulus thermobenzoicus]|uniref:glycosyltransferase family 4 protein n=1 Tax=Desulfofundulus thermobenzoicus TaxID=29376 RepID=UPI0018831DF8|nr:glycosyltransferase family 4 protein [Desulfofundulus thermobenzoicus]
MRRIAFVVQRYGEEVVGGAETLSRQVAERLAGRFSIDVLTTCALDYHTWQNYYPAGKTTCNGIPVLRFPVDYPRRWYFAHLNRLVHRHIPMPAWLEEIWMKAQGPYASKLFEYINAHRNKYDIFVFFTYLYCTTYFGLPQVKDRAVLVPTAHAEPPLFLKLFRRIFQWPRAFIFLSEEERDLVAGTFPVKNKTFIVTGSGIDVPEQVKGEIPAPGRLSPYLLYLGRVDPGKNIDQLFDYFMRFRAAHPETAVNLLLAGHCRERLPEDKGIFYLGFVDEETKYALIKNALAVVQPSRYESLSLVVLEAMALGTPVLVNGECAVLAGHCRHSGGGLEYTDYPSFAQGLGKIISNKDYRQQLGRNGSRYVKENYSWDAVISSLSNLLESLDTETCYKHIHCL